MFQYGRVELDEEHLMHWSVWAGLAKNVKNLPKNFLRIFLNSVAYEFLIKHKYEYGAQTQCEAYPTSKI